MSITLIILDPRENSIFFGDLDCLRRKLLRSANFAFLHLKDKTYKTSKKIKYM